MGKNSTKNYGEYMAKVEGTHCDGKTHVSFNLRRDEIKHIRRTLRLYDLIFRRYYPDEILDRNLSIRIHNKFMNFGNLANGLRGNQKKSFLINVEKKCSFPGCIETENLTIDHKEKASSMEKSLANKHENLNPLCPKHHLLKELNEILEHKYLEIEKLKERISDVENAGTTDCLGYQVLSNNKFHKVDLDIGEKEVF